MSAARTDTLALPIVRLHFTARVESPLTLPPYAGSMLRGALGHALLALAPLSHLGDQPCALAPRCAYCALFVTPPVAGHHLQKISQMPHPYVVEPPGGPRQLMAGDTLAFAIVLVGGAAAHWRGVIQAAEHALRLGLGDARARCALQSVRQEETGAPLWSDTGKSTSRAPPNPQAANSAVLTALDHKATLQFLTPLRLQKHNAPVRKAADLDARTLLIALARRYQLLLDSAFGSKAPQQDFARLIAAAEQIDVLALDLRWFDWGRYSQHQQREMKLGGLIGTLQLRGDLASFGQLLHLGQWLHVGKNATFGLGGYRLEVTR